MYRYRYINKHIQFGRISYTLILDDMEGAMPSVRIEKEFNIDENQLDEEFLYQEARKEIVVAQQNYNDWVANRPSEEDQGDY